MESIRTDDMAAVKDRIGIPSDMQSCHTAIYEEYFVEGHVPVEAIRKLLEEQPPIEELRCRGCPGERQEWAEIRLNRL